MQVQHCSRTHSLRVQQQHPARSSVPAAGRVLSLTTPRHARCRHQQQQRQAQPGQQQHQQQSAPQQQRQQPQHCHHQQHRRRDALGLLGAALLLAAPAQPAQASVTLTLKPKAQPKAYTLKAGYTVVVPDTWSLAYDRSADEQLGTQAFFAELKKFTTLSIFKLAKPEGDFDPAALLAWVLDEPRKNLSTFSFNLLTGDTPARREAADGTVFWDAEYTLAICRGLIEEGGGGKRRCVGPRDMDLEIVARSFFQTITVVGHWVYVVRGSSTAESWPEIRAAAVEATQSFALPPQAA